MNILPKRKYKMNILPKEKAKTWIPQWWATKLSGIELIPRGNSILFKYYIKITLVELTNIPNY